MTVEDFVASEKDLLDKFVKYWNEQHPDMYPRNLGYGDWVEHFQIFADDQ